MTDEESDAQAASLDYEIRIITKNYKLNDAQRSVIRQMLTEAAVNLRIKLSMVTQADPSALIVVTTVRAAGGNCRQLALPEEN
jgi:hypothetical protein